MELIDIQCSEDLKSKFLACHILDFNKNHVPLFEWFPNYITHTQQVVSMFRIKFCCEQLFSKMKLAKSMLYLLLSNHHLSDVFLQSTSPFNHIFVIVNIICLIYKLWLLSFEFLSFCPFKIVIPLGQGLWPLVRESLIDLNLFSHS